MDGQYTSQQIAAAGVIDHTVGEHTGVWLGRGRILREGLTVDTALVIAQAVAARTKRRAGVRGLVRKYGAASAARIVKRHTGRTIQEAPRGY